MTMKTGGLFAARSRQRAAEGATERRGLAPGGMTGPTIAAGPFARVGAQSADNESKRCLPTEPERLEALKDLRHRRHPSRGRVRRNHRTGGADLRLPRGAGELRRRIAAMDEGQIRPASGGTVRMPAGNFGLQGDGLRRRHSPRSRPDQGRKIQHQSAGDGGSAPALLLRRSADHPRRSCARLALRRRLQAARNLLRAAGGRCGGCRDRR